MDRGAACGDDRDVRQDHTQGSSVRSDDHQTPATGGRKQSRGSIAAAVHAAHRVHGRRKVYDYARRVVGGRFVGWQPAEFLPDADADTDSKFSGHAVGTKARGHAAANVLEHAVANALGHAVANAFGHAVAKAPGHAGANSLQHAVANALGYSRQRQTAVQRGKC